MGACTAFLGRVSWPAALGYSPASMAPGVALDRDEVLQRVRARVLAAAAAWLPRPDAGDSILYRYVHDNPVLSTDPGKVPPLPVGALAAGQAMTSVPWWSDNDRSFELFESMIAEPISRAMIPMRMTWLK